MISIQKYVDGVNSIYVEQPNYELGHDGSDGSCDCIGMVKGAIRRAGGDASGLSGTNYAVRHTIRDMRKITSVNDLSVGAVVLKGRQPGESGYSLPEKYQEGGNDFNGDLTDYYHIGTVTQIDPLNIIHMTTPTAKIDTKIGKWAYVGWLPQVEHDSPTPEPQPEPEKHMATVYSENGRPVNFRKRPSLSAALIDRIPCGDTVEIIDYRVDWCTIRWHGKDGYMMSEYLIFEDKEELYCVTIHDLPKLLAEEIIGTYGGSITKEMG